MPYTSYSAYIVQTNGAVILGIVALNHLVFKFNIILLNSLLQWTPVVIFEYLLGFLCLWNIWTVSKDTLNPYISRIRFPLQNYIFRPGPILTAIMRTYNTIVTEFFSNKKTTPSTTNATTLTAGTQATNETKDAEVITTPFSSFMDFGRIQESSASRMPRNIFPPHLRNDTAVSPLQHLGFNSTFEIKPEVAARMNLTGHRQATDTFATTSAGGLFSNVGPKLKYTPCIKPPLKPSAHRERLLWFLSPTKEVVDDFRIEQILGFQKHWHRFGDRLSRVYYDRMTTALLTHIFYPLQKSIDSFNAILAPRKQNIATCPPGTIALAQLIPNFNNESIFTITEVVQFITLTKYNTPDAMQYVMERIKELSANSKMAAYRFTPKIPGMPTDAQIIMHVLKYYLKLKEPYAIPPLVPEQGDLFKFLLIYFRITPELDHWKVFDLKDELRQL